MSNRYVVRQGQLRGLGPYADGLRGWSPDRGAAFVFYDDPTALALKTAMEWATAHAESVGGRVVRLVRRGTSANATTGKEPTT